MMPRRLSRVDIDREFWVGSDCDPWPCFVRPTVHFVENRRRLSRSPVRTIWSGNRGSTGCHGHGAGDRSRILACRCRQAKLKNDGANRRSQIPDCQTGDGYRRSSAISVACFGIPVQARSSTSSLRSSAGPSCSATSRSMSALRASILACRPAISVSERRLVS